MRVTTKLWIFLWTSVIFTDFVSTETKSCLPAEENKPYTLHCPSGNKPVWWRYGDGERNVVALCDKSPCTIIASKTTSATWNSTVSTLTVKNMSRTSFFYLKEIVCVHPGVEGGKETVISMCKFEFVYVRPEKPTCGIPSLSDTEVTLTCQTEKIYPTAVCEFYNKTTPLYGTVTYNNGTLVNQTTDYYRPQCTIRLSLGSDIGLGVHQFKVLMYPNVPGGINFGDESDLTSTVNLALPSASLSTSCSSGVNVTENYIKEGSTVRCQCSLDKDGNPPGWVEWFNSSNQPVSGIRDKTAVLTVDADSNGQSPDFICRGVSALGHEISGVSFKKEIAFGPTLENIQSYDNFDLCPQNPSFHLTVYCEVPVTSVNPEPTITVSINGMIPSNQINVTNTTHYRKKSVFTLTTIGKHEVTCLAKNSVFPTIQKQDAQTIEVGELPTSEPRIKLVSGNVIGNGETANVVEGDVITCYVEGGYPHPNVTLTCESGNNSMTIVQGTMEVSMNISYYKTEINCTCKAIQDVTVCDYNKTSWFTFHNTEEKAKSGSKFDVAAAVGGALAALFVIGLTVLICCILKRNGKLSKCCKSKEKNQRRQYPNQERKGGNVSHGSKEYVTPNEIYHSGRNSSEVVVPNEIYGKTSEVLTGTQGNARSESKEISTPNEIYGKGMSSKEVVVPNEIYGKGHAVEKGPQGGFRYTDYTDITPTITSATAVPVNMKKMRSKPEVALKPKGIVKPGQNSAGSKGTPDLVIQAGDVGGAYATVSKPFNSALPHSKAKRADTETQQIYPDPTWKPEIPDKKFVTDETELSDGMTGASNDYTNEGFVEDDHDENVYQNQNEPLSRT